MAQPRVVKIKLFDKQISAYDILEDHLTNELGYGGGARGGKSWLGNLWQLNRRISMPNSAGLIARSELTKLRDTTLRTFFKVAKSYGFDGTYTFNASSLTANFHNGSVIFFREIKYLPSDPEFDRLGSYDLTDAFLDEAQQISAKAISVLKGRFSVLYNPMAGRKPQRTDPEFKQLGTGDLIDPEFNPEAEALYQATVQKWRARGGWQTIPKALYTCNPKRNWIYTDFVQPDKLGTIKPYRKWIKALPADNPHTDAAYIENLMRGDAVTVQRLVFGNFEYDDDPSALCSFDAIMDMFTNDHVKGGEWEEKAISADLAMQGRDRFVGSYWEGLLCFIKIDKPLAKGKEIEMDLRGLMEEHQVGHSQTVVDSDGMGAYLESYLEGIKEFHGGARAFDEKEFFNLKSECGWKLAEVTNKRQIKIICSPDQRQAIMDEMALLKKDKVDDDTTKKRLISKEKMKEELGHSPDYLDNLLMRMYFLVKTRALQITEQPESYPADFGPGYMTGDY